MPCLIRYYYQEKSQHCREQCDLWMERSLPKRNFDRPGIYIRYVIVVSFNNFSFHSSTFFYRYKLIKLQEGIKSIQASGSQRLEEKIKWRCHWWRSIMRAWCLINQLISVLLFCLIKNNESSRSTPPGWAHQWLASVDLAFKSGACMGERLPVIPMILSVR